MVSPEGTRPEGSRPEMGRKGLFAVAILIVVVGFVVLGSLTSAEPAAIEETTTTSTTSTTIGEVLPPIDLDNFSVDQLQTGPQFDWEQAAIEDAAGYPIGLLSHEGTLYLFATSTPDWRLTDAGGLVAWRSNDGTNWESLGQVIEKDFQVSRVESTPGGLVAAGTVPDQSALLVWTSSDGENWVAEEIPIDEEHPHLDLFVTALGANQEALVVMTNVEFDGHRMLEQRFAEAGYEVDLDYLSWGTSYGVEGATLRIDGPLGLPGIDVELEDLELTEEEEHWVRNGYNATPDVSTWTRATGSSEWIPGRIERAQWVESIVTGGDGTMLLTGWSGTGPVSLQSTDGIQWTEPGLDLPSNRVFPWRDGLLAIAETSRPELLYSENGSDWTELGLGDRFPLPIQWSPLALATGDDGVVLSINGYETANVATSREPLEIVTEDGQLLIFDPEGRIISLDIGDETHTWEVYRAEPAEGIDVDMVGHTVTLDDPDTGESLAVLSFDELFRAEQDYYTNSFLAEEHQAIAFTEDGSGWTIQPTTSGFGAKVWIGDLHVDGGRVFAVTFHWDERFDSFAIPELNLWSAEIP